MNHRSWQVTSLSEFEQVRDLPKSSNCGNWDDYIGTKDPVTGYWNRKMFDLVKFWVLSNLINWTTISTGDSIDCIILFLSAIWPSWYIISRHNFKCEATSVFASKGTSLLRLVITAAVEVHSCINVISASSNPCLIAQQLFCHNGDSFALQKAFAVVS